MFAIKVSTFSVCLAMVAMGILLNAREARRPNFSSPLKDPREISDFGPRKKPGCKGRRCIVTSHEGADLISTSGDDQVKAVMPGDVIYAARYGSFGNVVMVYSKDRKTVVLYAHLAQVSVTKCQVVAGQQKVGVVGQTGRALSPHLHIEVYERGKSGGWRAVDPVNHIPEIADRRGAQFKYKANPQIDDLISEASQKERCNTLTGLATGTIVNVMPGVKMQRVIKASDNHQSGGSSSKKLTAKTRGKRKTSIEVRKSQGKSGPFRRATRRTL